MKNLENALKLHKNGNLDEARTIYLDVISSEPQNANAHNLLGVLFLQKGDLKKALEHLITAVNLNPTAPFLENLGLAYFCNGDFYSAAQFYKKALEKEKNHETLEQLVKCYEGLQMFEEAAKYAREIYADRPNNLEIIRKLAQLYSAAKDFDSAKGFYKKSLEIEPEDSVGLNNLGLAYENSDDLQKAKECYEKSLKIRYNYEALHNLGVLYRKERDFERSRDFLLKALELKPDNAETKTSLGMTYLSLKDFNNGYKFYSQRNPRLRSRWKNPWDGQKHPQDTLLVHFDGGHGDQIMFCRYIPFLKSYFKNIIFLVYPGLLEFMKSNFPYLRVCLVTDKYEYDFSANIMELHYHLGMDFEHIPSCESYLKADEKKVEEYFEKYFKTDKNKIGLFWQGNPKVFKNRAIPLKALEPLFEVQNCEFYSLQKNDDKKQIAQYPLLIDLESELSNFSDTAALIKNLDVLITIDTAAAHLAGSLGVKTFLMLPYASEWRWFSETKKTDWYPCVEIFKQKTPSNWEDVVNEVKKSLRGQT